MRHFIDPLTVVGVITILHGLAHLVPVVSELGDPRVTMRWFGGNGAAAVAPRGLVVSIFAVCAIGFVMGGLAATEAVVGIAWWRPFTDSAAIFSTIALVLFPNAFPPRFRYELIGLAVNIVIIGNWLQIWDWPI